MRNSRKAKELKSKRLEKLGDAPHSDRDSEKLEP